jgi:hypothetical protein
MYRQGLGDCFLLTFSTGARPVHVLIDCGVLKGTPDAKKRMRKVARDVLDTTSKQLDVLVATHEHWDHLSGFLDGKDIFEELGVAEVWLAWTEDPHDELARQLRARKARVAPAIAAAARELRASPAPAATQTAERLDALLSFYGDIGADGLPTTKKALSWVKNRATPRFLRPGEQLPGERGIPGIRTYVLGPPHDRTQIKRSDPSRRHSEVYELTGDAVGDSGFCAAVESLAKEGEPGEQPFDAWFRMSEDEARAQNFFAKRYYADRQEWRRIDEDWLGAAGRLALQLDSDTNNTSLVLAFELSPGGPVLLFPGDAQVGSWLSWESLKWNVRDSGERRTVSTPDLLARTVLYKVGHHASHNATLREKGLELMSSPKLTAMIPVNRKTAEKMDWNMPFPPLFGRLDEKTKGRILDAENGLIGDHRDELSAAELEDFEARTDVQPDWIDYTIEW